MLAGLSPDHYSRLEQGRQRIITEDVLQALSRALRLDGTEEAHLRHLAAPVRCPSRVEVSVPQRPDPGMLRVMTALSEVPVLLLGRYSQVLARNGLLTTVLGAELDPGSSFARWLLLDPAARVRITNWEEFAASSIGFLRYQSGRHPHDRRLAEEITHLRRHDPDSARWWDEQGVTFRTSLRKHIAHPEAGLLSFGIETVLGPHDPDQHVVIYTVEPDSPTARSLTLLAMWGTESCTPTGSDR